MNEERRALVTGAAGGIGADVARVLAARGVRALLVDRDPTVADVARELPGCEGYVADLADPQAVVGIARHALTSFGGCDILVNNAGIAPKLEGRGYRLEEIDADLWNSVFQVNLTAPFLLCRELMPAMRERGWGRVIGVASRAGRTYIPGVAAFYSASKAGLIGLSRQLAGEYAASGVTVNCVAPGPVETPLARQSTAASRAKALASVPAGRSATSQELAAAIDFLASEASGYVCGVCLDVNGGGFIG